MKIFLDTADLGEIRRAAEANLIDGITTNPSLVAKVGKGRDPKEIYLEICQAVDGPVSLEVVALDKESMVAEGRKLAAIHENAVVKVPLTEDGLKACRALVTEGMRVNVTLCFSVSQALLAAKAGASYVSPFVGRIDDVSGEGMQFCRHHGRDGLCHGAVACLRVARRSGVFRGIRNARPHHGR
jgi:transaldolase